MKEQAIALVRGVSDPDLGRNLLREYVQALILRSLHDSEAFRSLAFVGGTALRFLHSLARFSEDLDFSTVASEGYRGGDWMSKVKRDLTLAGFDPTVTWNERRVVHAAWVRLPLVLHQAGLSARPEEKLAIKLEIDTRPPAGARCERTIVTRHVTFLVQHHDLPSLLAGKLHAILTRPYAKGRDWYDLVWYLSQRPPLVPNIPLLQAALDQTHGPGTHDAASWRQLVRKRLGSLDPKVIRDDVSPFLERREDAAFLTRENLEGLL